MTVHPAHRMDLSYTENVSLLQTLQSLCFSRRRTLLTSLHSSSATCDVPQFNPAAVFDRALLPIRIAIYLTPPNQLLAGMECGPVSAWPWGMNQKHILPMSYSSMNSIQSNGPVASNVIRTALCNGAGSKYRQRVIWPSTPVLREPSQLQFS